MSSAYSSTDDSEKRERIRFSAKKINSHILENPDETEYENFELFKYKDGLNYRKRKADVNFNEKQDQVMENEDKRIKLNTPINEVKITREKMFQVSEIINFINFLPVESSFYTDGNFELVIPFFQKK